MSKPRRSDLVRQRYWQGQRLRSRDHNDQLTTEAQSSWWHNRAIHNAYGVARGLELEWPGDELWLSPGVAYDGFGRELVSSRWRKLPWPAADASEAGGWTLLASFSRAGADAEVGWQASSRMGHRLCPESVPLIRFDADCKPLDRGARPLARALARPRIGHGDTVPGQTAWQPWSVNQRVASGLELSLDTSAAGFTATPCYFAWIRGRLDLDVHGTMPLEISRITAATPSSFTLSLWLTGTPGATIPISSENVENTGFNLVDEGRRRLSVCWLGIEMPAEEKDPRPASEVNHEYF